MLFKEIIAVYTENHMKHINKYTLWDNTEVLIIKAGGTHRYNSAFET
jgi:hypothetical protein